MTEPLTIQDLNCSTCDIWNQRFTGTWCKCPMHHYPASILERDHKDFINHCGCASHPLALQVLAGPVIAELDTQATTAMKEITHKNIEQDSYRIGLGEGCRNAIKLLKGETP